MLIYRKIARRVPALSLKLRQARIADTPELYVQKTITISLLLTLTLLFVVFGVLKSYKVVFIFPFLFVMSFMYFIRAVDNKIEVIKGRINKEIVFAGRFMIIELESGVPVYKCFQNMAKSYEYVGIYFSEIVEKVDFGTTLEDALNETIIMTPSSDLRKLLWQVLNSMKTGADVTNSLNRVIEQIVREQQIAVKEYGRKLNPLAMFYMMIAIIIPSLGIVMLIVMATFIGFQLTLGVLVTMLIVMAFIQFMFLAVIRSSRPAVDI
ncbi:MAG: type II secretion system F family protein [Nanoarchaeota archaeon]